MSTKELNRRLQTLENARKKLKSKFVGLDEIIDQVIHLVTPWYALPDLQTRPVIINLWGLTGSGKTQLVRELITLLDFNDYSTVLDTGRGRRTGFLAKLENLYKERNGKEHVILLDEFQHARTIDEIGKETNLLDVQPIWDLFDSGKIQYYEQSFGRYDLYDLLRQLNFLVERGVKAENGKVTKGKKLVNEVRNLSEASNSKPKDWFIPTDYWANIYEELRGEYSSYAVLKEQILSLDHIGSLKLMERACKASLNPIIIDCTKCLVFVVGNLDEAFQMSRNTSSDSSADNLRKQSENISVSKIKESLLKRFRPEQVARLGNNHVIYPAFGTSEFKQIVGMKLESTRNQLAVRFGINCEFESSVIDYIISEGVTPAHGARPLFGTISSVVDAQLPHLLLFSKQHDLKNDEVFIWKIESNKVLINRGEKLVLKHELFSFIEKLKRPKKDDMQALVAVHEAGHALLHYLLNHEVPEQIIAQSANDSISGCVERRYSKRIMNKTRFQDELTILFGGLIAEELVFGKDNISFGAESDLRAATEFAKSAVNSSGMSGKLMVFSESSIFIDDTLRPCDDTNAEVKRLLEYNADRARGLLNKNIHVLKTVAKVLANEAKLTGEQFQLILNKFQLEVIESKGDYRSMLFDNENSDQTTYQLLVNPSLNHSKS